MFTFATDEPSGLDQAIDRVFAEMVEEPVDSEEYAKMLGQLTKLYSLKETPKRVSPDTLLTVAGNLLGIMLIIGHERAHVVTSKALGFVLKPR